jgi:hypothetical protein
MLPYLSPFLAARLHANAAAAPQARLLLSTAWLVEGTNSMYIVYNIQSPHLQVVPAGVQQVSDALTVRLHHRQPHLQQPAAATAACMHGLNSRSSISSVFVTTR